MRNTTTLSYALLALVGTIAAIVIASTVSGVIRDALLLVASALAR